MIARQVETVVGQLLVTSNLRELIIREIIGISDSIHGIGGWAR